MNTKCISLSFFFFLSYAHRHTHTSHTLNTFLNSLSQHCLECVRAANKPESEKVIYLLLPSFVVNNIFLQFPQHLVDMNADILTSILI